MIITDKDINNARNMLIRRLLTAKTGTYIKQLTNNTIDEFVVKLWIKSHYDENATFGDFSSLDAIRRHFKTLRIKINNDKQWRHCVIWTIYGSLLTIENLTSICCSCNNDKNLKVWITNRYISGDEELINIAGNSETLSHLDFAGLLSQDSEKELLEMRQEFHRQLDNVTLNEGIIRDNIRQIANWCGTPENLAGKWWWQDFEYSLANELRRMFDKTEKVATMRQKARDITLEMFAEILKKQFRRVKIIYEPNNSNHWTQAKNLLIIKDFDRCEIYLPRPTKAITEQDIMQALQELSNACATLLERLKAASPDLKVYLKCGKWTDGKLTKLILDICPNVSWRRSSFPGGSADLFCPCFRFACSTLTIQPFVEQNQDSIVEYVAAMADIDRKLQRLNKLKKSTIKALVQNFNNAGNTFDIVSGDSLQTALYAFFNT